MDLFNFQTLKKFLAKMTPFYYFEEISHGKSNKLLLSQAQASQIAGVKSALKSAADVNAVEVQTGETALHLAVKTNNLAIIELLLQHKARLDVQDKTQGWTPLMLATELNHQRAVLLLVGQNECGLEKRDVKGRNLINLALEHGKEKVAQFFLERGVDVQGALQWAIENDQKNQIEWCLSQGAILDFLLSTGFSPLVRAILSRKVDEVKYLLGKGADPNWLGGGEEMASTRGKNSLMIALETAGAEEISKEILRSPRLDCDAKDLVGENALLKSARQGNLEVFQILIEKNSDKNRVSNEGINLLIAAAQSGKKTMIQAVWKLGGFNIHDVDNRGWNALMHAARVGDPETVQFLLTLGADPSYQSPNLNIKAVDLAIAARRKAYKDLPEKVSAFDQVVTMLEQNLQ